jgi:hypothetical protein
MCACYPGPVGDDNLVSPVWLYAHGSPFGTVLFGHDGGRSHGGHPGHDPGRI